MRKSKSGTGRKKKKEGKEGGHGTGYNKEEKEGRGFGKGTVGDQSRIGMTWDSQTRKIHTPRCVDGMGSVWYD